MKLSMHESMIMVVIRTKATSRLLNSAIVLVYRLYHNERLQKHMIARQGWSSLTQYAMQCVKMPETDEKLLPIMDKYEYICGPPFLVGFIDGSQIKCDRY